MGLFQPRNRVISTELSFTCPKKLRPRRTYNLNTKYQKPAVNIKAIASVIANSAIAAMKYVVA